MKVAVDPGHGMSNRTPGVYDPGATHKEDGFRHEEASVALGYGLVLYDLLEKRGTAAWMTRSDASEDAPVKDRAGRAAEAGCDRLVSLHLNDVEDDRANGVEVLYRRPGDQKLAERMQEAMVAATGFRNRGVKVREDLAVLRFEGPALLIELGFIGNDKNRNVLLDPGSRERICEAIAGVIA